MGKPTYKKDATAILAARTTTTMKNMESFMNTRCSLKISIAAVVVPDGAFAKKSGLFRAVIANSCRYTVLVSVAAVVKSGFGLSGSMISAFPAITLMNLLNQSPA